MKFLVLICGVLAITFVSNAKESDPYIWLEGVEAENALGWVNKNNTVTLNEYATQKNFKGNYQGILKMLESDAKLSYPNVIGGFVYNFWRDKKHVKGIWRKQSINDYVNKKKKWKTLLDFDLLSKQENKNWVFKGVTCLMPEERHCLVRLSDGGKDAVELREYDLLEEKFVKEGFFIPEAKSRISWKNKDELYVATYFDDKSYTESGYPRFLKVIKRGQSLTQAQKIADTNIKNMSITGYQQYHDGHTQDLVIESLNFYNSNYYLVNAGNKISKIQIPTSVAVYGYFKGMTLFYLYEDLKLNAENYKQGSLLAVQVLPNGKLAQVHKVFEPIIFGHSFAKTSIDNLLITKNFIVLAYSDDLENKIDLISLKESQFNNVTISSPSKDATLNLLSAIKDEDKFFFSAENINLPTTIYQYNPVETKITKVQSLPDFYKSKKIKIAKYFVDSKDGTKIPYYVVSDGDLKFNGKNKTLISGYGGFNVSRSLNYSPILGKYWLNQKKVYVLANIRGGGEYGPGWHKAAILENKQKSYEDFIAITEDLIKRKISQPSDIAIMGGSNGGLLVGAVSMQRPDLYGAVISMVPLLDMRRYHKLLAGASWMSEYGDPDKAKDWDVIKRYSPYHNISKDQDYPKFLFYTSTKDDRVHPGHARKMVARMKELDIKDVYLYENTEGGHSGSSNLKETAHQWALIFEFLNKGLN